MKSEISAADVELWRTELGFDVESLPAALVAHSHEHNLTRTQQIQLEAIAKLRGGGMSVRAICVALKVSEHTVLAVEQHHPQLVATYKERMSALCKRAGMVLAESILEDVITGKMKPGEKGLAMGILMTKAGELDGQVPVANQHEVRITVEDLRGEQARLREMLKAAPRVYDVETSDSQSGVSEGKGL